MSARRLLFLNLVLLLSATLGSPTAPTSLAAETLVNKEQIKITDPLLYSREYVLEKLMNQVVRDCMPMKLEEFEANLKILRQAKSHAVGARIERAQYTARLEQGQLVAGEALLDVTKQSEGAARLSFNECRLALGKAQWIEDEPKDATLATGADGKMIVLVEKSSRLSIPWTLKGTRDRSGAILFETQLPFCAVNRLTLNLPTGMAPEISNGIVRRLPTKSQTNDTKEDRQDWLIELGGHSRVSLRIAADAELRNKRQLVLLRQASTYNLAAHLVNLTTELRLDVHNEPLRQLTLQLDPALHLTSAQLGDVKLPIAPTTSQGTTSSVVLTFPQPIQGADRVIRLTAIAPLQLDKNWKLPILTAANVLWQEGSTTLLVQDPLLLKQLRNTGCRQSKLETSPMAGTGEVIQLQCFSPDAISEVVVGHRKTRLNLASGTTVNIGAAGMTASQITNFKVDTGELFLLQADVARTWIVDRVETHPNEMLDDWTISPQGPGKQRLQIRLREAANESKPLQVIIHAHRRLPRAGLALNANSFRLVRFKDIATTRYLTSIQTEPPYQLEISGDSKLTRIDPQQLGETDTELLDSDSNLLFEDNAAANRLRLTLNTQAARYSADISITTNVQPGSLDEFYRIQCKPDSSQVKRLLVRFSRSSSEPLQWSVVGDGEGVIQARRLDDPQRQAVNSPRDETWEITLRRARSVPFEILARRHYEMKSRHDVSLVSLPEAVSQIGTLTIGSVGGNSLTVDHDDSLRAIPPSPVAPNQIATTRSAFRYDPAQDTHIALALTASKNRQPAAWIWACDVESRFAETSVAHVTTFRIENTGKSQIAWKLPADIQLQQVLLEGSELELPEISNSQRQFVVPLPKEKRYCQIQITCIESRKRFLVSDHIQPRFPQADIPVLQQSWTLWLPSHIAAAARHGHAFSQPSAEPTWSQRLFGSLRPPHAHQLTSPLTRRTWNPLTPSWKHNQSSDDKVDRALMLLGRRLQTLKTTQKLEATTWQQLLSGVDSPDSQPPVPVLLIDHQALASEGITSQTVLTSVEGDSDQQHGEALLSNSNLVLIANQNSLLLTSTAHFSFYGDGPYSMRHSTIAASKSDDASKIQNTEKTDSLRLVSVDSWSNTSLTASSPWFHTVRPPFESLVDKGWSTYRINGISTPTTNIRLYRPSILLAAGWAFMLLSAAGCWAMATRHPLRLVPIAAVAGTAALLVPAAIVPLITGIFQGTLLGSALGIFWNRTPQQSPMPESASTTVLQPVAISHLSLLIFMIFSLTWIASSFAAEKEAISPDKKAKREKLYKVFIPVDDQGKPIDAKVQVEFPFYFSLIDRVKAINAAPRGWLIHSAEYHCSLQFQDLDAQHDIDELHIYYDLEILQDNTDVVIPLHQKGLFLLTDRTKLDGETIQADLNADNRSLSLKVKSLGRYLLELVLRPNSTSNDSESSFELTIPRVPHSRMKVKLPPEVEGVEFPTALGATSIDKESGELLSELGPTDRLTLRWPTVAENGVNKSDVSVTQLLWLKVRPSSVVIDAQFRFSSTEEPLRELRLIADPRLRMLPLRADQPVEDQQYLNGPLPTILMRLKQPYQKEVTLNATFLLTGSSGVGNLRLPRLEALADRSRRRLLAVSISPSLEYKQSDETQLETIAVADFHDTWGIIPEDQEHPQLAFQLTEGDIPWSLSTQPQTPRSTARQQLDVSIGSGEATVIFHALLNTSTGSLFQHRLVVPPNLQIDEISLTDNDRKTNRVLRWSRENPERATVFLDRPVSGQQELTLLGRVSTPLQGNWSSPQITLDSAEVTAHKIRILHHENTQAKIDNTSSMMEISEEETTPEEPSLGRLVATLKYTSDNEDFLVENTTVNVLLKPNKPRTRGSMTTTLRRSDGIWTADVDMTLDITGGVVDAIRFDAPMQWGESLQIEPNANIQWVTIPGQSRRRLVIRPDQAISGKFLLHLRGTLAPTDTRVTAPDIIPLDVDLTDQFLVLPTHMDQQQIAWESKGLQEWKGREINNLNTTSPPTDSYKTYRILPKSRFQASIKDIERVSGVAQVRLADVHLVWQESGRCYGVATFDLEPAGLTECMLKLPKTFRLVQATVNDLPALLENQGTGRWQIALGSHQLSQRIGVIFFGTLPKSKSSTGKITLAAPVLEGIDVERTLYSIAGPKWPNIEKLPEQIGRIDSAQQEILRMETMVAMVDRGSNVVLESPESDKGNWYLPWARRIAISRNHIRRHQEAIFQNDAFIDKEKIKTLDDQYSDIANNLEVNQIKNQAAEEALHSAEPAGLWRLLQAGPTQVIRGAFQGPPRVVQLRYSANSSSSLSTRILISLLFMGLMGLTYFALSWDPLTEWFAQWPHAAGVLFGLAWWLWLTPSTLGLFVVFISLLGSFRHPWKEARRRRNSSE